MDGRQNPPENGGNDYFGSKPEGINKMPMSLQTPDWNTFPWQYLPGEHTMIYGFIRRERMPLVISEDTLEEWIGKYERYHGSR